jgi:ribosomal protein S24E
MRREVIREARMIRRRAINVQIKYETNGQPPRAQMLRRLRQWLEALIRNMQVLRAEGEAAREVEVEIWRGIR